MGSQPRCPRAGRKFSAGDLPAEIVPVGAARSLAIGLPQDLLASDPSRGISPTDPWLAGRMLKRKVKVQTGVIWISTCGSGGRAPALACWGTNMALEAASSPFKRPDDSTVDSCSYTPADVLGTLPLHPPKTG